MVGQFSSWRSHGGGKFLDPVSPTESGGGVSPVQPIAVTVCSLQGAQVAELLAGPRSTVRRLKLQLAGLEGTPAGNQTLLLGGRALRDSETLSSLGVFESTTLMLVRCEPLLSGRLSRQDLEQLLEDASALELAVDAFSADPEYSKEEVEQIVIAVSRALLPDDKTLERDILRSLPLNLLVDAEDSDDDEVLQAFRSPPRESSDGVAHHDMSRCQAGHEEETSREERRERFICCIRAALEVLRHALAEQQSPVAAGSAAPVAAPGVVAARAAASEDDCEGPPACGTADLVPPVQPPRGGLDARGGQNSPLVGFALEASDRSTAPTSQAAEDSSASQGSDQCADGVETSRGPAKGVISETPSADGGGDPETPQRTPCQVEGLRARVPMSPENSGAEDGGSPVSSTGHLRERAYRRPGSAELPPG